MGPERVEDRRDAAPRAAVNKRFEELLARRKRPSGERAGRPRAPPAAATVRGRLSSREASRARDVRGAARTAIDAAARGRLAEGVESTQRATGRIQGRARELHQAESGVAVRAEPRASSAEAAPTSAVGGGGVAAPAPMAPGPPPVLGPLAALADAGPRAERALALVEKVERFLRSGRPGLSVTLRTREPTRVELERVGRATVSLRLAAPRPLPPEEVELLRTALATRGLRLHALAWVPLHPAAEAARERGASRLTPEE